jgi:hypothetical protein
MMIFNSRKISYALAPWQFMSLKEEIAHSTISRVVYYFFIFKSVHKRFELTVQNVTKHCKKNV